MDVTLYSKVTEITKVISALFIFNPCAPEQQNDVKSAIKDPSKDQLVVATNAQFAKSLPTKLAKPSKASL